jgi:hypothetical protein
MVLERATGTRVPAVCACGTRRDVDAGNLARGLSRSCGCWRSDRVRDTNAGRGLADKAADKRLRDERARNDALEHETPASLAEGQLTLWSQKESESAADEPVSYLVSGELDRVRSCTSMPPQGSTDADGGARGRGRQRPISFATCRLSRRGRGRHRP